MTDEVKPTFWQSVWAWAQRIAKTIWVPIVIILLVVGAGILVVLGFKQIQIGGLIGKLLGRSDGTKTVDLANSIPSGRVDSSGNLIPIGKPDSQGMTQAQVVKAEEPGLFGDPTKIRVTPPGQTTPIEVKLPDGVKAQDVEHVVIVQPEVVAVTVKDSSNVSAKDVDDLLAKYGSQK